MTPKEKAKDLYLNFMSSLPTFKYDNPTTIVLVARKCALIAVDEIIATLNKEVYPRFQYDDTFEYWENVKNEINKL